jgi:hypothetical protein
MLFEVAKQVAKLVDLKAAVNVQVLAGVNVGFPEGRVLVDIDLPERFARQTGRDHVRDVGADWDAVRKLPVEDGQEALA